MVLYNCEACLFSTEIKQHFQRHNTTKKHLFTQKVNIEIPEKVENVCKYCERKFSCKQSMYRHIKYTCNKNKDEDLKELVRLLNNQLEEQKKGIHYKNRDTVQAN